MSDGMTKGEVAAGGEVVTVAEEEVEAMPEIELSSDEEASDDDVALIVLKRPPVTERVVEEEVVEDVALCGESTSAINAKVKEGYVKEFIETEGLAMILSKEFGLVLFHLDSVYLDGQKAEMTKVRGKLPVGTEVRFVDRTYRGEEYRQLSEDGVIHQAVAVWRGARPDHLLRKAGEEEHRRRLDEQRKSFMLYVKGDVFLRAALVRVKGEVAGYLTDSLGIVEHKDEDGKKVNILFHTDDVKIFRKELREYQRPAKQVLPVGCLVSADARRVHVSGVRGVDYQAVAVLAGTWPDVPHPTLLPGGQGSTAPAYDLPAGRHTFYYLELALEAKLQRKLISMKEAVTSSEGKIQYDWKGVGYIQSQAQFEEWREALGGRRPEGRREERRRDVLHMVRAHAMEEEELPAEKRSKVEKRVVGRTWYTPEAWEHGGLRIKAEVKEEGSDGAPPTKRLKKEAAQ